jgi:hypothetical protein
MLEDLTIEGHGNPEANANFTQRVIPCEGPKLSLLEEAQMEAYDYRRQLDQLHFIVFGDNAHDKSRDDLTNRVVELVQQSTANH